MNVSMNEVSRPGKKKGSSDRGLGNIAMDNQDDDLRQVGTGVSVHRLLDYHISLWSSSVLSWPGPSSHLWSRPRSSPNQFTVMF